MQSRVFAFIVIHMDGDFFGEVKGLAIGGLDALHVSPEDVVGFAGRDSLGKFAMVVGVEFPLRAFIFGTPDLHGDAIYRMIIRSPDGSKDQSVGLLFVLVFPVRRHRSCLEMLVEAERENLEDDTSDQENTREQNADVGQEKSMSSHRLRSPRLLLPPLRSPLRLPSIPVEWW